MKIDWKFVATTPGYISLKGAYKKDLEKSERERRRSFALRKKKEFLTLFNWVINRAKHYAHVEGVGINVILDRWEKDRDYWWLNYYRDAYQPKLKNTYVIKPLRNRGLKKYYSKMHRGDNKRCHVNFFKAILFQQKEDRLPKRKKKPRWSSEYKKSRVRMKSVR